MSRERDEPNFGESVSAATEWIWEATQMTNMDKPYSWSPTRRIPSAPQPNKDMVSLLRRRATLAIIVVCAGMAVGISICSEFLKPSYSSSALVRVSPTLQQGGQ